MKDWFETMEDGLWLPPDERGEDEAQFLYRALRLRRGPRVLDAPSGAGRVAIHLAKRGCVVTCADLRQTFIDRAKARFKKDGAAGAFMVTDLRKLDISAKFNAIYNWFGSFGYFDKDDDVKMLRNYVRALKRGGRLLIDRPNRQNLLRHFIAHRKVGEWEIRNSWDAGTQRITSRRYRTGQEDNGKNASSMRLYTLSQMKSLYEMAGLTGPQTISQP